ncbi:MAG: AlkA N-terminal domain-containing protein [Planctomycetota bacterium]
MSTEADNYYRAAIARDARFDGLFFVAVTTTGIYCRPVCPARKPLRKHCRFFGHPAAAERAGFRPCLRCRPELAPGLAPVDASSQVARRAIARIQSGALDGDRSLEDLARELGVSSRHMRRVVQQEFGAAPAELARTQRLLLAKQLLTETRLAITEVAFASGFASLRRFNAAFLEQYRWSPTQFRRQAVAPVADSALRLRLPYHAPLAWGELLSFLGRRAIAGVECIRGDRYTRTVALGSHRGWLEVTRPVTDSKDRDGPVTPRPAGATLQIELSASLTPVVAAILPRLRRLFDLHARPTVIDEHLGADPSLRASVLARPGLRVPGAFDGFELAWRAVLGQQVSVAGATTLSGRFAERFGEPVEQPGTPLTRYSPSPATVAAARPSEIARIGVPLARARTLQRVARLAAEQPELLSPGACIQASGAALQRLDGVGPWTASYVAMRALGDPDAFVASDLGIQKALGQRSVAQVLARAEPWRPWRAYAALHLWSTLESKGASHAD